MAASFPNGTVFSISTKFAPDVVVTGTTNAASAVATFSSGTIAANDIVLIQSGWSGINNRVAKVTAADATTATLGGIDTSDTDLYQPGAGTGILMPVKTWVQLSQVTNSSTSGGDQQFYTWQYLEDRTNTQKQRPTYKNAKSITLTLDYDSSLAWYEALSAADAKGDLIVLRAALPNGAQLFYPVYPSFDSDPSLTMNENMKNTATFSATARMTRYEAA